MEQARMLSDWQKGYDLDFLKALARPFAEAYRPYSYGAFGVPKERDCATALQEENLYYLTAKGDPKNVVACCIYRTNKTPGKQKDFSGRSVTICKDDFFIRHCAIRLGYEDFLEPMLYNLLKEENNPARITWIEIHEENNLVKGVIMRLGFQYFFTKISASSDIKSLYVKKASQVSFVPDSRLPAAEVPSIQLLSKEFISEGAQKQILQEIADYEENSPWAQHYSNYNKRKSWTAFALKGYKPDDPGFIIQPDEMSKQWKKDNQDLLSAECKMTVAAEHFPMALTIVGSIPGVKERVRFMKLSPGGELTRHADVTNRKAGVRDGMLSRLHIPLTTSECTFFSWGVRGDAIIHQYNERDIFYLDQRKPHAVVNRSKDNDRVHLVMDVESSETLRSWIAPLS